MNRCTLRNRRSLSAALVGAGLICTMEAGARGESASAVGAAHGVRHQIYVSVVFDPGSPLRQPSARATLTALLRISDHARDANFFGTRLATFSDFAVSERPPQKLVWEDRGCHQERSVPVSAVVALNGLVSRQGSDSVISARPRHLGQTLPTDEIIAQQAFAMGHDQTGNFLVKRMVTRQSRVQVEVKLYIVDCVLALPALPN